MNYIRGAVNAISAPYQYYKDLPPINPATLTGAIDVIVIQRPTDSGDSELVCSPFHVRFGKWQVLRPGEKKVNVSVNGHPIPYSMKIGEAGEAFFVFETDDDIPDDLITSPLLQPLRPEDFKDRAGLRPDIFRVEKDARGHTEGNLEIQKGGIKEETQEPEFLDLDALPSRQKQHDSELSSFTKLRLSNCSGAQPTQFLLSPPPSPEVSSYIPPSATPSSLLARTEVKIDPLTEDTTARKLNSTSHNIQGRVLDVEFRKGVSLDIDNYHPHDREGSKETVTGSSSRPSTSPQTPQASRSSSPNAILESSRPLPLPMRAMSEPPPDVEGVALLGGLQGTTLNKISPPQEYSWEWGAFPQPSPMKTTFGKPGRSDMQLDSAMNVSAVWGKGRKAKGKSRLAIQGLDEKEDGESRLRSRSVPPGGEGSPKKDRMEIRVPSRFEDNHKDGEVRDDGSSLTGYGPGGRLESSRLDPALFILSTEGRRVEFELSLVSLGEVVGNVGVDEKTSTGRKLRGRKNRDGSSGGQMVFDGRDDAEATRSFDHGKINYTRFLTDESILKDKRLVVRWGGSQYIICNDGSPLLDMLVLWRDTALREFALGPPSRPSSPSSNDDDPIKVVHSDVERQSLISIDEHMNHSRSKSEPPEKLLAAGKPTFSSWVQWWSRSRGPKERNGNERPELGFSSSAFPTSFSDSVKPGTESSVRISLSGSAPTLPSMTSPEIKHPPLRLAGEVSLKRKFAKSLRLTSDQLKAINLKPGANTITFSLSTSGVIACTAQIFVWDSTDLVVVSDIDGTITKSDGLGHVFAMLGRDWTHVGVAKLYTDITRNGYKIMYLTSRAIGQADSTRDYLKGIKQDNYQLPEGPVIMSPDRLMASLHREVIMRKPEVFKMACLRDIQKLFGEASRNPFYAGFGNRITDALSYRSVNVPSARIFTIDSAGEVKMELLELAGYKSSYIHMTDIVDQMFPPIHRKWAPEFTDFNFWKAPVQDFDLPEFTPPSPALSARSDTSNQSTLARLRNFSLVGNKQGNNTKYFTFPQAEANSHSGKHDSYKSQGLKQMSSFERLSNTLSDFAQVGRSRSTSPESSSSAAYADSGSEDDYDNGDLDSRVRKQRRRSRRQSMTSMPGSLDDEHLGMDDDNEIRYNVEAGLGHAAEEDVGDVGDEDTEETFDEHLLAAGEMKNVPFL